MAPKSKRDGKLLAVCDAIAKSSFRIPVTPEVLENPTADLALELADHLTGYLDYKPKNIEGSATAYYVNISIVRRICEISGIKDFSNEDLANPKKTRLVNILYAIINHVQFVQEFQEQKAAAELTMKPEEDESTLVRQEAERLQSEVHQIQQELFESTPETKRIQEALRKVKAARDAIPAESQALQEQGEELEAKRVEKAERVHASEAKLTEDARTLEEHRTYLSCITNGIRSQMDNEQKQMQEVQDAYQAKLAEVDRLNAAIKANEKFLALLKTNAKLKEELLTAGEHNRKIERALKQAQDDTGSSQRLQYTMEQHASMCTEMTKLEGLLKKDKEEFEAECAALEAKTAEVKQAQSECESKRSDDMEQLRVLQKKVAATNDEIAAAERKHEQRARSLAQEQMDLLNEFKENHAVVLRDLRYLQENLPPSNPVIQAPTPLRSRTPGSPVQRNLFFSGR